MAKVKLTGTCRVNLSGIEQYNNQIKSLGMMSKKTYLNAVFDEWAALYFAYLTRRYMKLRKGGKEWKKLAPYTIKQRRLRKPPIEHNLIFTVTGTLRRAISKSGKGRPGHYTRRTKDGITCGVANVGGKHPEAKVGVGTLVELHAKGKNVRGRKIPKRKLIIPPSEATKKRMVVKIKRRLSQVIKKANNAV